MEYLMQKVSYLKGLADGLDIEDTSKEGKLLLHIVDTLEEFADVLEETIENQIDLEEYVDFIDEDLADVEEDIYGLDEDYDEEDYDDLYDDEDFCCYFEEDELEDELED